MLPAVPDLKSFTPGAHVLPQQQVVEGDSTDGVELLLDHLLDEVWVHAVLDHGGMEKAELLEDGLQRIDLLLREAGGSFPQACWFGPQHPLDGLMFQHACH